MRPWVLVALTACSPREEPAPKQRPPHSIDIPTVTGAGAPFSLREVEVVRGPNHSLELGYRVETADKTLEVPGEFTCRVQGFNLVYPATARGKLGGPQRTGSWRPDPFAEDPEVCQIDWRSNNAGYASACYRAGELSPRGCSPGTFPPRTEDELKTNLAGKFAVDLVHASFELRAGAAIITGIFTVLERLAEDHRIVATISCDEGQAASEAALPLIPLERLAVGSSVYGPATILLDHMPADGALCTFRLVSRPTKGPRDERELAKYCVTAGTPTVLTCPL